jgi:rhamnopyranosyl-N-acetylglucosaminyl-diphospho-decaprenol beta-1,3/1,4-galactofuranosyltransferase
VIAVVVLTHNRVRLLRRCVERVLMRTSDRTTEIVLWDNASTDGTEEYLASVSDPRLLVVAHPENIGVNAYRRAAALTSAPYLVELDDDVVEAPRGWDATLLDAFVRLPRMGYLSASYADDPYDTASRSIRDLRDRRHAYEEREEGGIRIQLGPTGGSCTITSRAVYDEVGGFRERRRQVFWREDAAYAKAVRRHGYRTALLPSLEVSHAGGDHYSPQPPAKCRFQRRELRWETRKDRARRVLLAVRGLRAVDARGGLEPPS